MLAAAYCATAAPTTHHISRCSPADPTGRRYGVVAGTGRLLEALPQWVPTLTRAVANSIDPATVRASAGQFRGDIDSYARSCIFQVSPVLSVRGS